MGFLFPGPSDRGLFAHLVAGLVAGLVAALIAGLVVALARFEHAGREVVGVDPPERLAGKGPMGVLRSNLAAGLTTGLAPGLIAGLSVAPPYGPRSGGGDVYGT